MSGSGGCLAVVVAFHGDAELEARVATYEAQVEGVLLVDNSVAGLFRLRAAAAGWDYLHNANRDGIAGGLEEGCRFARERGYRFALTMDQDGRAAEGMVALLLRASSACHCARPPCCCGLSRRRRFPGQPWAMSSVPRCRRCVRSPWSAPTTPTRSGRSRPTRDGGRCWWR